MSRNSDLTPENVFERLERDRKSGKLKKLIFESDGEYRYGLSETHPGKIAQYDSAGNLIAIGDNVDGKFVPISDNGK